MILWDCSPTSSRSAGFPNKVAIPRPNNSSLDLLACRVASRSHVVLPIDLVTIRRWLELKKSGNNKCWQRYGEIRALIPCWWERKMVHLLWKTVWQFLKCLNVESPYDPAIALPSINPREMKIYVQLKTSTQMFIVTLFIIDRKWKQPKCLPTGQWINKMWSVHK